VLPVDGLVSAGQWRPVTAALEGRADAATSALVRLVGEVVSSRHHPGGVAPTPLPGNAFTELRDIL
jgi:hypothetical protein